MSRLLLVSLGGSLRRRAPISSTSTSTSTSTFTFTFTSTFTATCTTKKATTIAARSMSNSASSCSPSSSRLLRVLPEVRDAISLGRPVVALESTILAHGLPHPENIQLAREVSRIIRSKGAIPATVAIKNGLCRVGLTEEELCDLAVAGVEKRAVKCSTRDIPLVISTHQRHNATDGHADRWGATTVASTMRLAHLAGISTFVTGACVRTFIRSLVRSSMTRPWKSANLQINIRTTIHRTVVLQSSLRM